MSSVSGDGGSQTTSLDRLTEGQKACLRLVMLHMSSKEIARSLQISPHTVDQRLRVAARNMGVSTRFEAARLLATQGSGEPAPLYQPLISQPIALATEPALGQLSAGAGPEDFDGASSKSELEMNTARVGYHLFADGAAKRTVWPLPPLWGDGADALSSSQKMLIIGVIAVASLLAFGSFLSGLDALSRLM